MAEDAKTDILMLFQLEGQPVWAEGALMIDPKDDLMSEFKPPPDFNSYSNYFQITEFELGMELAPKDGGSSASAAKGAAPATQPGGTWSNWYQHKQGDFSANPYELKFNSGSFGRILDCASPVFFTSCCNKKEFSRAIIVKRMAQGENLKGVARLPRTYMRLDFTSVLIKSISWDDGDLVTEKCTFTAKKVIITYRQQKADGTVDGQLGDRIATWPSDADAVSSRILRSTLGRHG